MTAAAFAGSPAWAADEPAAASTVLTVEAPGGTAVAVGDVLTASVAAGTTADFATAAGGSTGIKCSQSAFTATVTDNPEAPGVASESVTAHTFAACTSNILGVTRVNSVTVNNTPFATTVESGSGTVTVSGTDAAPVQTTLSLGTILGSVTCVYRAVGNAITGVSANADNSISFADQAFTKFSGPVTCPGSGFFTARYAPVLDSTATGSPAVFTN
ncbi:Tat pathway signal sequence domain protein [Symbioplanes lichenis]|uniref:Tat pathway signal sequence domain protein n=1 Tax=Symbioplanes lichenis TaxID=1629072 RepID=UPI0027388636|nr:Tat pathway signal sequence domain protein [Actinoplanes lichenis]